MEVTTKLEWIAITYYSFYWHADAPEYFKNTLSKRERMEEEIKLCGKTLYALAMVNTTPCNEWIWMVFEKIMNVYVHVYPCTFGEKKNSSTC